VADVDELIAQLTLGEKAALVRGRDAWTIDGCARLGVPAWTVSDGPVGIRGRANTPTACFPSASAIAATFDTDLVSELGRAIGEEAGAKNVLLALGPTINIHRHPLGGRHFECYSEDPYLTARTAVAYIEGVQATGVGACAKHFVANDQEYERHRVDIEVSERALREIYLAPFEAAVREAGVRAVMGAYNSVNGGPACAHPQLLVELLKGEWEFDGFVVTDWGALRETVAPARHGCDLEMPGPGRFWGGGRLEAAVEGGLVDEALVDDKVRRLLGFLDWTGALEHPPGHDEAVVDSDGQRALARRAAVAGTVLLQNGSGLLPLRADELRSVAVIGPNAHPTAAKGGGSATVNAYREVSVLDGLRDRLPDDVHLHHAPGCSITRTVTPLDRADLEGAGVSVELYATDDLTGEPLLTADDHRGVTILMEELPEDARGPSARAVARYRARRSGVHRFSGGGLHHVRLLLDGRVVATNADPGAVSAGLGNRAVMVDRRLVEGEVVEVGLEYVADQGMPIVYFTLGADVLGDDPQAAALAMLDEAVGVAASADAVVLVVGSNDQWETEGADRDDLALPGDQDELVRRVAATHDRVVVVHNSGAPMTMPWAPDVAAILQAWYPGQEAGHAIADVLLGDADPGGRLPTTWPRRLEDTPAFGSYPGDGATMRYEEGVFVGYRWYDARGIEPLWPFGHGLSYASFDWSDARLAGGVDGGVTVELTVTNISDRVGTEVVQAYVEPPPAPVERPHRELAGFATLTLEPGRSRTVAVDLHPRAFARWDEAAAGWVVDGGDHVVRLGASSRDLRSSVTVVLDGGPVP
jgi:beta-glucosidase